MLKIEGTRTSTPTVAVTTTPPSAVASSPHHLPGGEDDLGRLNAVPNSRHQRFLAIMEAMRTPNVTSDKPFRLRFLYVLGLPLHPPKSVLRKSAQLQRSYESTGDVQHLNEAILLLETIVGYAWKWVQWRMVEAWKRLGFCLYELYDLGHQLEDLDDAITSLQRADDIRETFAYNDDPELLFQLSRALRHRFHDHNQDIHDLHHAISCLKRVFARKRRPHFCADMSLCLRYRFETVGKKDDLKDAIWYAELAVTGTTLYNQYRHMKPRYLDHLSLCQRRSFESLGNIEDLDSAIDSSRRAIVDSELIHTDDATRADLFASLSSLLYLRFERLDELEDLNGAIEVCQQEVDLMRNSQPNKCMRFDQLSVYLRRRFERLERLGDLEDAIKASRKAIWLGSNDLPEKSIPMEAFRGLCRLRSERLHALGDIQLDDAISRCRNCVEPHSGGPDSDMAEHFANLGLYLYHRFVRHGDTIDLETSISATQNAIDAVEPDDCSGNSEYLMTLGHSLVHRYERRNDLVDLEKAISVTRRALDTMIAEHPAQRVGDMTLGRLLQYRFDRFKDVEDIEDAVLARRRVVESTPAAHEDMPRVLDELSISLCSRFMHDRTLLNYNETRACFEAAIAEPLGEPSIRLSVAIRYAQLLSDSPDFSSAESLLLAHAHIIDRLPEIAWLGHSIQRRFEDTARFGELVNRAVSAAIEAGSLRQAVEWLEAGRTLIWSQILSLRTPLDDIGDHHPDLAQSLFDIHSELRLSGIAATGRGHSAIVADYEGLLSKVRHCVGCKNFLRPRKLAGLISSPVFSLFSGTLVLINIAESGCDALLLSSSGNIKSVKLVNLTQSRAQKMHGLWTRHVELCGLRRRGANSVMALRGSSYIFARVLDRLWTWVVEPILTSLNFSSDTAAVGQILPHVVWCPTGPLTQLPLHAAGVYDSVRPGPRVSDVVISSYIPSLAALIRCCDGVIKEYPAPNVLVVTQPNTPGRSPLPGTQKESALLHTILPANKQTLLEHKQATVEWTLAVIGRHPWIHLACHGSQNLEDPTQSAFALHDGLLTLNTLMGTVAENAELAFLSACQTAAGDEKIPEESAHLAAGMLAVGFKGVVATMWSIRDDDAPIVVEEYYKKLLEYRNTGSLQRGQTGAAYALHKATERLRDKVGERNFERWVPFVHYGV